MLEFLVDNIFVVFGGKVFQQIVGIPMGTNCAPLLADFFWPKLCCKLQNSLLEIEYTLLNVLIWEIKIYCGPDKFYGRSKFGQYD